ncbi:MAG: amino acid ABC transporter substrate-binding protein [Desulfobacteraceae bacterium]|nr:amino acid ABC transporter substrate-binding protein [Desulfobacteraceae bacterium]
MNTFKVAVVTLFILLNATQIFSQTVIKIRVTEWPPHYYNDKKGNWAGLDVELAKTLVEASGFKSEFVKRPWSRALAELKRGTLHLMTNLELRPERAEYLHYIGPEHPQVMTLLVNKKNKSFSIKSLDDMVAVCKKEKKQFGYQRDIFYSPEFDLRMKTDQRFKECFQCVTSAEFNLRKTQAGRILGFFDLGFSLAYRIKHDPSFEDLTLYQYVISRTYAFYGVSKKGVEIQDVVKLYDAYEQLISQGTIQRIRKKWENKVFTGSFNSWESKDFGSVTK